MSQHPTEQVIHDLAQDVPPVRRIPPLRAFVLGVVGVWALAVVLMMGFGAPASDFVSGAAWGDPRFAAVLLGLALVAGGATLAALASVVPGREQVAGAGGATAAVGLGLAAGGGLWSVFTAASPAGVGLMGSLVCLSKAGALGLLPVLVASLFLARGFVRRPLISAGFAVMGTAALGGLVIHIGCRNGGPLHVLLSHALSPLFLGLLLAIPVGRLIRR